MHGDSGVVLGSETWGTLSNKREREVCGDPWWAEGRQCCGGRAGEQSVREAKAEGRALVQRLHPW